MGTNLYHVLGFIPATEGWEMPPALEALARALVATGKLRINADTQRNFVRMGTADSDQTFTARELNDAALAAKTRAELARHVPAAEGAEGVEALLARLRADLKKAGGVSADKEMKVARVLVQSAHPVVIQLLLTSGTELFVSYSHTVGDLMAVHQWQTHGTASGMQATQAEGTAVYVSAGGDPFFEGDYKQYVTDGFPALARMVVIAGQELGHFADLRRTAQGVVGRHSTDPTQGRLRASPRARDGRRADMQRVAQLQQGMMQAGLARLLAAEKAVGFYHVRLRFSPPWWWHQMRRAVAWLRFRQGCRARGIAIETAIYPYTRHGEACALFLSDMAFNLAPDADAYRDPDPLTEEAIAVIEAVARVPQQVHKWGHAAVKLAWPQLYAFYYDGVIEANLRVVSGRLATDKMDIHHKVMVWLRRRLRPRPDYYPEAAGLFRRTAKDKPAPSNA